MVRIAPKALSVFPKLGCRQITVEVIEPEEEPNKELFTGLRSLPPPAYRIPRRPNPSSTKSSASLHRASGRRVTSPDKPRSHRLSKKRAAIFADKEFKRQAKKTKKSNVPSHQRYSKICEVSCNGPKTFADHVKSKSHRIQVKNVRKTPVCTPCGRLFESHGHLERHINGADHLKVVTKSNLF